LDAGREVVAFTRRGSRPSLRRCRDVRIVEITAPEDDADAAISELATLLRQETEYRAVMPLDDAALWLCDQASRRGVGVAIAGPTEGQAELALDKRLQIEAARSAGFAVPRTTPIDRTSQLLDLDELPAVLKPALPVREHAGRLRRGSNFICANQAELRSVAQKWAGSTPLLAQPLLTGVGEGLFGLAGAGRPVALSAHRRVRMMNPQGSGSSACISVAVDTELAECAASMLSSIGWRGLFMLEFLRDADGTAWFMELNGRTWGSIALARRLGLEYPAWAIDQLDRADLEPHVRPREGQVCRHLGRELVHLLMVLRGPRSVGVADWPSPLGSARDVFSFHRSDRWYNWRPGDTTLFIDDTLNTVLQQLRRKRR
jgi:predicted ATP-grasp superfamily ATP-dependent carboligase